METRIREKTVAVYGDMYFEKTSSGSGSTVQLTGDLDYTVVD